jgi:tight adherence protein C
VRALVAAMRRADRHGAPLGPALAALAAQARADRARAAREAAARAAPKVQLAVASLLVPGAMLLIASALLGALTS